MTLSKKLYGTVCATAGIGLLVAACGIGYLRALGAELRKSTDRTAIKLDLVNASRARAWEMVAALRGAYFFANFKNQAELQANDKRWHSVFKRAQEQIDELRPLMDTDESRADLEKYEASLHQFDAVSTEYLRICKEGTFERLPEVAPGVQNFANVADQTLNTLKDIARKDLKAAQSRSDSLRSRSLSVTLMLSGVLVAISILALWGVRTLMRTFGGVFREFSKGAEQVASTAIQVSGASQSLADGASQQAASLEETLSSSEEISAQAQRNTDNTRSAAGLVTESQGKFVKTNASLNEMVAAMGEISAHSEKISRIIKSIDEIAFQTNILALNAAVEAARAGEAGLGFAVVADEVRNLAQRCAQAASNTAALIEESIAKSNGGQTKVDQVAVAVRAITEAAGKVKSLVDEVNSGSLEQARGTEEIGKAIRQMQHLTENTATQAEESAAAAQSLSRQSAALKERVQGLTLMIGGG